MMTVDNNVSDAINLIFKLISVNIKKFYWIIRFHPQNPITNFIMKRKYEKLAQELHEELTNRRKSGNLESEV
jgi:hypothetical protein